MVNALKQFILGTLLVCSTVSGVGCSRSDQSTHEAERSLVLGLSADYPPFEFKKNGEIVGLDVDIARAIAKDLNMSLSIQDMDFSALIPSLQSGRIDFVMSGMTITEERKKNIDFSQIYYTASFAIVVDQASEFAKEDDLQNKRVGAQLGSTMEKYAREKAKTFSGMQIVALAKNPMLIQELKSGRIDGVLSEEVQAISFVEANPSLKQVRLGGSGDGYAVAFAKGNVKSAALKEKMNRSLEKLKASGELDQIKMKWLGK